MITEAVCNVFFALANTCANFLPSLDVSQLGGFTAIVTSIMACSAFMPVSAFWISISVFMSVQGLKLSSNVLNWSLRKIPTIG